MNKYINVYTGNPTGGGTDGTAVSTDGEGTNPISVTLDASKAESQTVKLAVRCESGYATTDEGATLSFSGSTADKWGIAAAGTDENAAPSSFSATLTLGKVSTSNVVFWVRATSSADEEPQNDTSVKLHVSAKIVAVG